MKSIVLFFIFCIPTLLFAQHIRYEFAAPNAAHHEAQISITVDGLPAGPAVFRMSRSSPGRYATHEFGKNVYNVSAVDEKGNQLAVQKTDPEVYQVAIHKSVVTLTYTLYGNYADGTYAGIDVSGFHLNMPAVFMWVKGMDKAPITVHFTKGNSDWKIATQLKPTNDNNTFTAPGLQYFMDSPTKIGNLHIREWTVTNPDNKTYTFRLALEAEATESLVDSFAKKVEKLVKVEQAVYGEVPAFDYGTYTFIASINPYVKGDGMEHRNSTMITSARTFNGSDNLLPVFAHEFFHCWNVERIRPKSLEPFNFEKSNMSEAMWVAEGFTQYYGQLLMKRAGFTKDEEFLMQLAGLINAKENTPGGQYYSPIENSQRAVFADAGVSIDKNNYPNMFTSYYVYGGALALALDLQLRATFNSSLDMFMRQMWKQYGKPEKPYTLPQMQETLASVSNKTFAADFFKNNVYGHQSIDYNKLLKPFGFGVNTMSDGKAWLGNTRFTSENNQLTISGNVTRGTPFYAAGLDVEDVLLSVDGTEVHDNNDLNTIVQNRKPGDRLNVSYKHRTDIKEATITLTENPLFTISKLKDAGKNQIESYKDWISSSQ